jgi:hypothetical protein
MSLTLAAVPMTLCTSPDSASTPMCAFMPKCQWLPFFARPAQHGRRIADQGADLRVRRSHRRLPMRFRCASSPSRRPGPAAIQLANGCHDIARRTSTSLDTA